MLVVHGAWACTLMRGGVSKSYRGKARQHPRRREKQSDQRLIVCATHIVRSSNLNCILRFATVCALRKLPASACIDGMLPSLLFQHEDSIFFKFS